MGCRRSPALQGITRLILLASLLILTGARSAQRGQVDAAWRTFWMSVGVGVLPELTVADPSVARGAAEQLGRWEPDGWRAPTAAAVLSLVDGRLRDANDAAARATERCKDLPCAAFVGVMREVIAIETETAGKLRYDDPLSGLVAERVSPMAEMYMLLPEVRAEEQAIAATWACGAWLRTWRGAIEAGRRVQTADALNEVINDAVSTYPTCPIPGHRELSTWALRMDSPPSAEWQPAIYVAAMVQYARARTDSRPGRMTSEQIADVESVLDKAPMLTGVDSFLGRLAELTRIELRAARGDAAGSCQEARARMGDFERFPRIHVAALGVCANASVWRDDLDGAAKITEEMLEVAVAAGLRGLTRDILRQFAWLGDSLARRSDAPEHGWQVMQQVGDLAIRYGALSLALEVVPSPAQWARDNRDYAYALEAARRAQTQLVSLDASLRQAAVEPDMLAMRVTALKRVEANAMVQLGYPPELARAALGDDPEGEIGLNETVAVVAGDLASASEVSADPAAWEALRRISADDLSGLELLAKQADEAWEALQKARSPALSPLEQAIQQNTATAAFISASTFYVDLAFAERVSGRAREILDRLLHDPASKEVSAIRPYVIPLYLALVAELEGDDAQARALFEATYRLAYEQSHAPRSAVERRRATTAATTALIRLASLALPDDPAVALGLRDEAILSWLRGAPTRHPESPPPPTWLPQGPVVTVAIMHEQRARGWHVLIHDGGRWQATHLPGRQSGALDDEVLASVRSGTPTGQDAVALAQALQAVPAGAPLALVVEPALHAADVHLFPVDGAPLAIRNPLVTSPSLDHLRRSAEARISGAGRATIAMPVTSAHGLQPSFNDEIELSELPLGALMWSKDATVANAVAALERSGWVHLSSHGARLPGRGTVIRLADGELDAPRLATLTLPGSTVLLSACYSSDWSPTGLDLILIDRGARAVVSTTRAVSTQVAARWIRAFVNATDRGASTATAAQAAYEASRELAPAEPTKWGALTVIGAPG